MLKDYIIVENAFSEPLFVRDFLLNQHFYTHESFSVPGINIRNDHLIPKGSWRGFRTQNLTFIDDNKTKKLTSEIFDKAFENCSIVYECTSYGHICPEQLVVSEQQKWHRDPQLFAGIVYLNESTTSESGTFLNVNGNNIYVENKFNRMLIYRGELFHRVGNFFGNCGTNSRLTFTFFISKIMSAGYNSFAV